MSVQSIHGVMVAHCRVAENAPQRWHWVCAVMAGFPWALFVAGAYVAVGVLTFVLYALDKAAAVRRDRRIPERTLLIWGLLGGWPGGLVAQRLLRHKTSKLSFQLAFWGTVLLHAAVVAAIFVADHR